MNNILIESKEWFDRINGNSYFSSRIEIDGELVAVLPLQYGYGSHCDDMAGRKLDKLNKVTLTHYDHGGTSSLRSWCARHHVEFKSIKHDKCLKRDVKAWGIEQ